MHLYQNHQCCRWSRNLIVRLTGNRRIQLSSEDISPLISFPLNCLRGQLSLLSCLTSAELDRRRGIHGCWIWRAWWVQPRIKKNEHRATKLRWEGNVRMIFLSLILLCFYCSEFYCFFRKYWYKACLISTLLFRLKSPAYFHNWPVPSGLDTSV